MIFGTFLQPPLHTRITEIDYNMLYEVLDRHNIEAYFHHPMEQRRGRCRETRGMAEVAVARGEACGDPFQTGRQRDLCPRWRIHGPGGFIVAAGLEREEKQ